MKKDDTEKKKLPQLTPGDIIDIMHPSYAGTYDEMYQVAEDNGETSWNMCGPIHELTPESRLVTIIAIAPILTRTNGHKSTRIAALVITPSSVGWVAAWQENIDKI